MTATKRGTADNTPARRGRGALSTFTQEKADDICEKVSQGIPLAQICRDIGMGLTTWYDWMKARPELAEAFARAREAGYDMIAADALRIADTPVEGIETTMDEKGTTEKRSDMLGHRKLQVETRLKLLAKWDPKRYGERLAVGGSDDLPPVRTESVLDVSSLSTTALAEIMKVKDAAK